MPVSRDPKKSSIFDVMGAFPTDNASAEAAWRQALLLRELARDDRTASRQRRAEAVASRAQAEHDAITSTKQMCAELQAQARIKLQEAEDALAQAQQLKAGAQADAQRALDNAQAKMEQAAVLKREAEHYAEEVQSSARAAADALLAQARAGSQEIANRMRQETAEEIRKALSEMQMARAAAEDELETQRILTETARIRAFSNSVSLQGDAGTGVANGNKVTEFKPATPRTNAPAARSQGDGAAPAAAAWKAPAKKATAARKVRKVA